MMPTILSAARGRLSQSADAYRQIKELIVSLALAPGALLDESALSAQLGIGRTPIREALIRLALEHLIIILPRRGTLVADLNASDLRKLFEIRLALETSAMRLAAERATPGEIVALEEWSRRATALISHGEVYALLAVDIEAHRMLVQASHNEFLVESVERLLGPSLRISNWLAAREQLSGLPRAVEELLQIVLAIRSHDGERAAHLMYHHIADFQASLRLI